jgi:glycosyltransferase involved in cell wall biosynthesis
MKVTICISTYNGHLFFDEQIRSILNQSYRDFNILIRDDGSTDLDFIEKLKEYQKQYDQIKLLQKENLGISRSFFELLKSCPLSTDLVILADQDDVWMKTRIENTVKLLESRKTDTPLLCSCGFEYVDEDLNFISRAPVYKHMGFNNALVQNPIPGCTICINNAALRILQLYTPAKAVIHDWWIYLVISAMGTVIQEPDVAVKYRQHRFNVLGGTSSFIEKNQRRFKRKLNTMIYKVYDQVREFKSVYNESISEAYRKHIDRFLKTENDFGAKCLFLFDFKTVRREKPLDNLLLKIVIIISGKNKSNL